MRASLPVTLTLPNDLNYLSLLNAFLDDLAKRFGFSPKEALQIQLSAEETFANIVEHDFPDGKLAPVEILWEPQPLGMTLRFRHKGQPLDPELFPTLDKQELEEKLAVQGLGTFLLKQMVDEVQYNNRGYEGQEVVLIKHLATPPEEVPEAPLEADPATELTASVAEVVPYTVRPLKLEESVEVARLAYHAYSYSYPYEHIYFPDRVKKLNAEGSLASFVAITEEGEIISHAAMVYDAGWPGVAELGVAFTKTNRRGLGCFNRLFEAMIATSQERGDFALFLTGVTTHPYSQKTAVRYGMNECALMLSKVPGISFQNIHEGTPEREHLMNFFRFQTPREAFGVHAPAHHREMIGRIYQNLGCEPRFEGASTALAEGPSQMEVTTHPGSMVGVIDVRQAGRNAVNEVRLALRRLCVSRFETVFLELNLTDPATAQLCHAYEEMGFFFSGILPREDGHDRLVFQFLNNQRPDYEAIRVASDFGQELLDYVKRQDRSHALL
ncbi:serine-protein kinase RsbW [compost metagenome]